MVIITILITYLVTRVKKTEILKSLHIFLYKKCEFYKYLSKDVIASPLEGANNFWNIPKTVTFTTWIIYNIYLK